MSLTNGSSLKFSLLRWPLLRRVSTGMDEARRLQPDAFQDLNLYHSGQHHVEAEARLVQALPPDQVVTLFHTHCASRLDQ